MECRLPKPFDGEADNLDVTRKNFLQEFNLFLKASGKNETLKNGGKTALLLNIGGSKVIEVYNGLDLKSVKKYDVAEALSDHFAPIKSVVYERYKFLSYPKQSNSQSIEDYVVELRKLASTCEYQEKDDMIRDKIVVGLKETNLRQQLLEQRKLTLKQADEMSKKFQTILD